MLKYRHNRYEQLRTASVMFFQLGFAFLIPEFMARLNESPQYNLPYYDLKSMWPLNYYLFDKFYSFNCDSYFILTPLQN